MGNERLVSAVASVRAAQGIGATYAIALARDGANVAVCDILDPGAVSDFATAVLEAFGSIDGLVNNAALFATLRPKPIENVSSEEFDRVLRVNVRGTFEMIRAVLPAMRRQGYGKIVNIALGTVFKGTPFMVAYVASKGAMIGLTRAVARETGGTHFASSLWFLSPDSMTCLAALFATPS